MKQKDSIQARDNHYLIKPVMYIGLMISAVFAVLIVPTAHQQAAGSAETVTSQAGSNVPEPFLSGEVATYLIQAYLREDFYKDALSASNEALRSAAPERAPDDSVLPWLKARIELAVQHVNDAKAVPEASPSCKNRKGCEEARDATEIRGLNQAYSALQTAVGKAKEIGSAESRGEVTRNLASAMQSVSILRQCTLRSDFHRCVVSLEK